MPTLLPATFGPAHVDAYDTERFWLTKSLKISVIFPAFLHPVCDLVPHFPFPAFSVAPT